MAGGGWSVASARGLSPPAPLPSARRPAVLSQAGLCGDRALPSNSCYGEPLSEAPTIERRLRLQLADGIERKGGFISRPGWERVWAFKTGVSEHGAGSLTTPGSPCPWHRQEMEQTHPLRLRPSPSPSGRLVLLPVPIQLGQHVPVNSSQKGNHNSISSPRNDKQLKYGKATAKYSTVLILHQKKKSDKKNKPSCVHISLNMYPTLRFPPAFGVMNMSICQGSWTIGPTPPAGIGERPVGFPPGSAAQGGAESSEQRATDIHFPTGLVAQLLQTAANPFPCVSISLLCLSCQHIFAKCFVILQGEVLG